LRSPSEIGKALSWTVTSHTYTSKYNAKLNKCFVHTEANYSTQIGKSWKATTSKSLNDAYGGQWYATYSWTSDDIKKYWEVPPSVCELTPKSSEKTNCKSLDEYMAFVAVYME
jgi:hypothetical protein